MDAACGVKTLRKDDMPLAIGLTHRGIDDGRPALRGSDFGTFGLSGLLTF